MYTMRIPSTSLLLVSFLYLIIFLLSSNINAHNSKVLCIDKEKQALLDFKLSFVADPLDYLSTWSIDNIDCCEWNGVTCSNGSGHVTSLDFVGGVLGSYQLRPSLVELQHLTDLSLNGNFLSMRIPKFIGSLSKLRFLDLSLAGFFGEIPPHLGNLSMMQFLDLGSNSLYANNLKWLSHLSSIEYLDLSNLDLSDAIDWASTLKMLPTLSTFICNSCFLRTPPLSSISHANSSTSLHYLDLSNNSMSSSTFSLLVNGARDSLQELSLADNNLNNMPFEGMMFPSLMRLDLSGNQLNELHPQDLLALSSLTSLDVSSNRISGDLQEILQYLPKNLISLEVSFNRISGNLPELLQYLPTHLITLDLSSNLVHGVISDAHFLKFSKLHGLQLSDNNLLVFNFSKSWVPPFQLNTLELRSCKVGPRFPNWILTQKNLEYLDISNSMISGLIPDAFWDLSTRLTSLNLSHNNISCMIPNSNLSYSSHNFYFLDLSYNAFLGPIPLFLFTAPMFDLSHNKFSSFPPYTRRVLSDSPNTIYLSNNHLSGSLPNWLFQFHELFVLNLSNNNLSGALSEAIGSLRILSALHLSNNRFSGKLPLTMKNCAHLTILELDNNKFSGVVPFWLGESMAQLIVLNLRSNIFSGILPSSLCHLQSLQILDLSDNQISGSIPSCLYNFTAMSKCRSLNLNSTDLPQLTPFLKNGFMTIIDGASVIWKGALVDLYGRNLEQRNVINLSGNWLTGEIPIGVTTLKELRSLDLSRNYLNGSIPDKIGQLTFLELLKLSSNTLRWRLVVN